MNLGINNLEVIVTVNVIQVQERQKRGIVSGARQTLRQIAEMELSGKRPADQAVGPIIEIAEYNSRPGNIHGSENIGVHEPNGLLPALVTSRAEMHIKYMHQAMTDADVRAKHTSFFPAADGQIDLPDVLKFPSAQGRVSVNAATVFSGLPDREEVAKPLGEKTGLVVLDRCSFVIHYFLQSDDVRIDLLEYPRDAFYTCAAIEATPFMNVVGRDPKCPHVPKPSHLILDQRREHFFAFLQTTTPAPF